LEHRVGEAPLVAVAPNQKRFLAEDTRCPIKGFDGTTNTKIKFDLVKKKSSLKHYAAGGG